MAIIEFVNGKNSSYHALRKVIKYIKNPEKTEPHLTSGLNCDTDNAFNAFVMTKRIFDKEKGRQYIHLVQSFNPDDNLTPELAHEVGIEFMKNEIFKNFQIVMATHTDTNHLHNHLIINTVNFESGLKWQLSKQGLEDLKSYNDELCLAHDLSVPIKEFGHIHSGEYRAIGEMRSWKHELTLAIKECRSVSTSIEEFISRMNDFNYQVDWDYKGEDEQTKYYKAVINTCKYHSTSTNEFIKNMNVYGFDVSWKYKLKTIPINDVEELGEEFIFDNYDNLIQYTDKINKEEFNVEWTDQISFVAPNNETFSPETFENHNIFSGTSLRDAFELNAIKGVKVLPEEIKVPVDDYEIKKLQLAVKTCKQYAFSKEDFIEKLNELGIKVHWDIEPKEKEIIKASIEESKKASGSLDEFIKNIRSYGYTVIDEKDSLKITNDVDNSHQFEFKRYDANVIFKEFVNDSLDMETLKLNLFKRYKDADAAQKQFDIFFKRINTLVEHGYIDESNGVYKISQKGVESSKQFKGFNFTTYDANVVFDLIDGHDGSLSIDQLWEHLKNNYADEEYAKRQYNYLIKRLDNNVKHTSLKKEGDVYFITDFGTKEKERVLNEYRETQKEKKANKSEIIKISKSAIVDSLGNNQELFEAKPKDELINSLIRNRKHIVFETESGKRIRNRKLYPSKQYSKDALYETFLFNSTMKHIIDISKTKTNQELELIAQKMGFKLEFNSDKQIYDFAMSDDLKCYFSLKNIEDMKNNIHLPDKDIIYEPLKRKKIMFTTPDGKKCLNSTLKPFGRHTAESLEGSFKYNEEFQNRQAMEDRFELLMSVLSLLPKQIQSSGKLPLSYLEGDALKEKAMEESKGRGLDWRHANDNGHGHEN